MGGRRTGFGVFPYRFTLIIRCLSSFAKREGGYLIPQNDQLPRHCFQSPFCVFAIFPPSSLSLFHSGEEGKREREKKKYREGNRGFLAE